MRGVAVADMRIYRLAYGIAVVCTWTKDMPLKLPNFPSLVSIIT